MSKGEDKIARILSKAGYRFEREKTFQDLRHGRFRYDFYVFTKSGAVILEYDGEQHFEFVSAFYKTNAEWTQAKEHDRRKNSYCLANNIPIYRIPYWEIDSIQSAADLWKKQYLVKSRWHNDELKIPKK